MMQLLTNVWKMNAMSVVIREWDIAEVGLSIKREFLK